MASHPTLNGEHKILHGNGIHSKLGEFDRYFYCKQMLNFTQKNQTTEITDTKGRSERQVI